MSFLRYTAVCSLSVSFAISPLAYGQAFPVKPIRIVTSPAGGGTDFGARVVAQALAEILGQQVVVENRPGTIIPSQAVASAAPDGYTLLFNGSSLITLPLVMEKPPFDPVSDFAAVTLVHQSPNVLVVHPSLPVNSVAELVNLARSRPGQLNYSSSGTGSTVHLAAELFKSMGRVDIVRVEYRGSGPATIALMAGETTLQFATPGSSIPHVKSGRLKALAVTTPQPTDILPGVPTVAATGLPGYECVATNGIMAPAGTPPAIVNRLSKEIARLLQRPDVKQRFFNAGSETIGSTPEEYAAAIKTEMAKWGKVIREANIRVR